jgi:hypothetical protein
LSQKAAPIGESVNFLKLVSTMQAGRDPSHRKLLEFGNLWQVFPSFIFCTVSFLGVGVFFYFLSRPSFSSLFHCQASVFLAASFPGFIFFTVSSIGADFLYYFFSSHRKLLEFGNRAAFCGQLSRPSFSVLFPFSAFVFFTFFPGLHFPQGPDFLGP